jgi:hypothetical protein
VSGYHEILLIWFIKITAAPCEIKQRQMHPLLARLFLLIGGSFFLSTVLAADTSSIDTAPPLVAVTFNLDDISWTGHGTNRFLGGYVDEHGTWRVLPRWERSGPFHFSDGLARVRTGDKVRYIDPSGAVHSMERKFLFDGWGTDGFICKKYASAAEPVGNGLNGTRTRLINRQGELVFPNAPSPRWLFQIKNRCVMISGDKEGDFFFDVEHGELTTNRFQSVRSFEPINKTRSTYYAAVKVDGLWGFLDDQGQIAVTPKWIEAWSFGETGLARVRGEAGWVFIDYTGAVVIPAQQDQTYTDDFSFGYAVVREYGSRQGYINTRGKWLFDKRFDNALPFGPNGLAVAKEGENWGYTTANGQWEIEPIFLKAESFKAVGHGFVARVTDKNHCMRLIDSTGKFLTNFDEETRRFQPEKCPLRPQSWELKTYTFLAENLPAIAVGLGLVVLIGTGFACLTRTPSHDDKSNYLGVSVFSNLGQAAVFGFIGVASAMFALDEIVSVTTLRPYFRDVYRDYFYLSIPIFWVLNLVLLIGLRGVSNAYWWLRRH